MASQIVSQEAEFTKVDWVLIVEAVVVPDSWRHPEGWRTLKDFVRDNIGKGGQPGKVNIVHGKAYIPMLDPVDACMGFNALVGIWWDGWRLTATLSEHRNGQVRIVAGPTHERCGQRIQIESVHYQRQREPATLRRPRNVSSAKNNVLQRRTCPDPEYTAIIEQPTQSPLGLLEHYFLIQPGSCPTVSSHATAGFTLYQVPSVSSKARPNLYVQESACVEDSGSISQGHQRFESSSSSKSESSTRNGPIIVRSS